jgi:hypothetical protein
MPRPDPNMDRLLLEQQKFALKTFIEDEVPLTNLEVNTYRDEWLYGIVAEFRTHIWSHKLPPENVTTEESFTVATWNSAWQLWKANHAESKWFGWIAKKWPPQKRGTEVHKAVVSLDLSKKVLFPEYTYPAGLGTPYHHVVAAEPRWMWASE